jgi:hypothetical protein
MRSVHGRALNSGRALLSPFADSIVHHKTGQNNQLNQTKLSCFKRSELVPEETARPRESVWIVRIGKARIPAGCVVVKKFFKPKNLVAR